MGFSITWCAMHEATAQKFLSRSGLTPTGESEEYPESLISMAKLDNGWQVLWYNEYECPFLMPGDLAELSRVEEHVMASSSELWSGGKRKWWISHEGEDGPSGLESGGELPPCFAPIRQQMEEAQRAEGGDQADVDYLFEIPLKVAEALVGFKHDEEYAGLTAEKFLVLSGSKPKKSFLGRLFGR